MEIDRAIEILNPEHREQYDSLATVQEACRMGMAALEKLKPKQMLISNGFLRCPECGSICKSYYHYCDECGQAVTVPV